MISVEDVYYIYEYLEYFKIFFVIYNWCDFFECIKDGKCVLEGFVYESDSNIEWMSIEELC